MSIELTKLKALKNNVSSYLIGSTPREQLNPTFFYDPLDVKHLFTRFCKIRDSLIDEHPTYFDDFPVREFRITQARDFQGRGCYERKQLENLSNDIDMCLDIFEGVSAVSIPSMSITKEGVFFAGQYYDAITYFRDLIGQSTKEIIIIDSFIDEKILDRLKRKRPNVIVKILTDKIDQTCISYAVDFNRQYSGLEIKKSRDFHDRFIIIDDTDFYHFGASFKDLGNRGFMFSRIEEQFVIKEIRNQFKITWSTANQVV